ncbi:MAG: hypothetical protein JXR83_17715 [Deltaproteobacteria bacterium]|nr:hypothetical protein [Deltaproteobacteria bacterium]
MASRSWIALIWLPLAAPVRADDPAAAFRLSASLGPEYDSNARREMRAREVVQDALLRGSIASDLALQLGDHRADASLTAGAKVFGRERSENTVAAMVATGYRWQPLTGLLVGADFNARGRRILDGDRSYESALLDALVSYGGLGPLAIEARLGPRLFNYEPDATYSDVGAGGGLTARLRLTRSEQLALGYQIDGRYFPQARVLIDFSAATGEPVYGPGRRADVQHSGSLQLVSARDLFLSGSYLLLYNQSSNLGETFVRHRLQAVVGLQLPLDLFASATAALQITRYPGGLALSQRLLLEDSDESQNKLVLTLQRPLTAQLALEWRLGFFGNELSDSNIAFARATAYLGITYRPP